MLPLMATRLFCLYSFSNFPLNFVNNEKEKQEWRGLEEAATLSYVSFAHSEIILAHPPF